MKDSNLWQHILKTYFYLRLGIGILGILFPFILVLVGLSQGIELQNSMSAYYHAYANGNSMRNWFVGILWAIGFFLILYYGWNSKENWALNIAGVCGICVAMFPMQWNCGDHCSKFSLHGFFAISLFLCMAYVCIACAQASLEELESEKQKKLFKNIYIWLGIGMIVLPLTAFVLSLVFRDRFAYKLIVEALGIEVFGCYWIVKTIELFITKEEERIAIRSIEAETDD